MEWSLEGEPLSTADALNQLSSEERTILQISFDGRWNISALMDVLEDVMTDASARCSAVTSGILFHSTGGTISNSTE